MRIFTVIIAAVVLALCVYVGARPIGPLPPVGALLDPANGIWNVAATADLPGRAHARIPGLSAPVRVVYDDRGVPHIFAATEGDAERALGYVVARDRLFELEAQWRAGAGALTELVGAGALDADREVRHLGMPAAAESKLAALVTGANAGDAKADSSLRAVEAFADGVNAYRDALAPRDYPIEYKLLGRAPAPWQPINSIHLFDRMALTLAYNDVEFTHNSVARRFGAAVADALYPVNSPLQEPIQPSSRTEPRTIFRPIPAPGRPDTSIFAFAPRDSDAGERMIGSNNWAVAPKRTKDGHALLAGDPHLGLSLPSIWYEAHLVVPGHFDVYGVTIPGAPSIIIGFNRDVAWTFTNTEGDVLDRYVETVDDTASPKRYRLDGSWRDLTLRVEHYRDARGRDLRVDTVRFTHRGPMERVDGRWISMRWTALDSAVNVRGFIGAQRAKSVQDFWKSMAEYRSPTQNMLSADRLGSIAIRSTGIYPVRPGNGRGDILRDGSTSKSDWIGALPLSKYPQSMDPAQGFLSSNNQQPIDPADFSGYLGSDWYPPWRALRINELLRANASVTVDDMRRWQTDRSSPRADLFVPAFLNAARTHASDPDVAQGARYLAQWNRTYTANDERAMLFEFAMDELSPRIWDELADPADRGAVRRTRYPDAAVVAELMQQPRNVWWDDKRTPNVVETRDDILAAALGAAYRRAVKELGSPDDGGWRYGRNRTANVFHLMHIPALSALNVPSQGGPSTLNPLSGRGTAGSSWRMVVQLGPEVRAWGTYPGGQSGNPASDRYLSHLVQWSKGELDTLRFPRGEGDLPPELVTSVLTLTPAQP